MLTANKLLCCRMYYLRAVSALAFGMDNVRLDDERCC